MAERERVGFVQRNGTRFYASCALCSWEITKPSADEATRTLLGHADLTHPALVPIYRDSEAESRDR